MEHPIPPPLAGRAPPAVSLALLGVVLAAAVAGCAAPSPGTDASPLEELATPPAGGPPAESVAGGPGGEVPVGALARRETFAFQGHHVLSAAGTLDAGENAASFEFPVDPGARRIRASLTWSAPGSDLDVALLAPGTCRTPEAACLTASVAGETPEGWTANRGGTPATPDSPSIVEVTGDLAACSARCTWTVSSLAKVAVAMEFAIAVEVEYAAGAEASPGTAGLAAGGEAHQFNGVRSTSRPSSVG